MKTHEKYMNRCLELAKNGFGTTYLNPMVGSVIVFEDKIIGEGWHQKSGEPHAEVNAINSVSDKNLLKKATIYVNLEPCSHFGKTPPCADLIVKYQIPNVVVGTLDSNLKVSGNGIKKLQEAGAKVVVGVLEKECYELNKRFFTFHNKKRPYIILKWAETLDGFVAPLSKLAQKPVWITNEFSRQIVHQWRSQEQAILVGTQTVLEDNPKLNVRDWTGTNPVRIILDQHNRLSKDFHVFDNQIKTIIISAFEIENSNENLVFEKISFEKIIFEKNIAQQILNILHKNQIQSVIIEGGTKTLQTFIDENLWDEARVFVGQTEFKTGLKAPIFLHKNAKKIEIENDKLLIFKNYD